MPEQVWDSADVPERELRNGEPSGSAMPLVWAHAEYVKLIRSLDEGRVFDMPPQTVQRYVRDRRTCPLATWRFNNRTRAIPEGRALRVETLAPAVVHWSADEWATVHDTPTTDTGLGIHHADLPTHDVPRGRTIRFTMRWLDGDRWEGTDFAVEIRGE